MSWLQRFFKKSITGATVTLSSALSLLSTLSVTGASILTGGATIAGSLITSNAGTPEAAVTGVRKGDLCVDYTNGKLYVFGGTAGANTGWKLVTSAA